MQLTAAQETAIGQIKQWLRSSRQEFVLAGYAGTGKTTLLQQFINDRDTPPLCLAPTGKAASVLAKRLEHCDVRTIHSALYKPVTGSTADLEDLQAKLLNDPENKEIQAAIEEERERLSKSKLGFAVNEKKTIQPGQLVIVDEASMVTNRIRADLAKTQAKLLYVGDPGQLPPVADDGFMRSNKPDVMLDEILRQALDSPIIRLSMMVRTGQDINLGQFGPGVRKLMKDAVPYDEWLTYDQVVTGTNLSRRKVNRFFRTKLYPDAETRSIFPMKGDRLICLKNEQEDGVYYINGVMATALEAAIPDNFGWSIIPELLYEGKIVKEVVCWTRGFEMTYDPNMKEDLPHERQGMRQFDYAYAITVHKSQGSEWPKVILADDQMKSGDRNFRSLWLYTAVTRAKEELLWLV
jgi:exodeoxyribonuclease-5